MALSTALVLLGSALGETRRADLCSKMPLRAQLLASQKSLSAVTEAVKRLHPRVPTLSVPNHARARRKLPSCVTPSPLLPLPLSWVGGWGSIAPILSLLGVSDGRIIERDGTEGVRFEREGYPPTSRRTSEGPSGMSTAGFQGSGWEGTAGGSGRGGGPAYAPTGGAGGVATGGQVRNRKTPFRPSHMLPLMASARPSSERACQLMIIGVLAVTDAPTCSSDACRSAWAAVSGYRWGCRTPRSHVQTRS